MCVCVWVCVCVCLLSHISPWERLFVLKTLSCTQRATKVSRSRATALPALYGYHEAGRFLSAEYSRELAFTREIPTAHAWEYIQKITAVLLYHWRNCHGKLHDPTQPLIARSRQGHIQRRGFGTLVLLISLMKHCAKFQCSRFQWR